MGGDLIEFLKGSMIALSPRGLGSNLFFETRTSQGFCHEKGRGGSGHSHETRIPPGEGPMVIAQSLMSGIWKNVNRFSWDLDRGKKGKRTTEGKGFLPVEPIQPERLLNEPAYLI